MRGAKPLPVQGVLLKASLNSQLRLNAQSLLTLQSNIRQPPEVQNVHAPGFGLQAVTCVLLACGMCHHAVTALAVDSAILQTSTASPVPHASLGKEPFYNSFINHPDHIMLQLLGK